jgi:hypothetical protein
MGPLLRVPCRRYPEGGQLDWSLGGGPDEGVRYTGGVTWRGFTRGGLLGIQLRGSPVGGVTWRGFSCRGFTGGVLWRSTGVPPRGSPL